MLAICWDHWRPVSWTRVFPYEIFLFFFLVMTGYLITGSLLRERERSESAGKPWRMQAMRVYQIRRGLRILAPYYAALALAFVLGAKDLCNAPWWYLLHGSNLHMATLAEWPDGTNHFWSLSMQQQFYLVWPFVIWFLPRRLLVWAICAFAAVGPLARWNHGFLTQWFARPEVLTPSCLDYFGIGGLLALAVHRGMSLESPALRGIAAACFAGYLAIFGANAFGVPTPGFLSFQQTLLSIALCGFIAAASVGFPGPVGRFLMHPVLQRIGALSYGVYLFHNLAPLLAGKPFWFLWGPGFSGTFWDFVRILIFAMFTWLLALASWKWIEEPLQRVRGRVNRGA